MKKRIFIILLLILFAIIIIVVFYQYKSIEKEITIGTPIFNSTISDSKKNNTFLNSYTSINNKLFNEIWLEKKMYHGKEKNKKSNIILLNFSFKNKDKNYLDISKTSFNYLGYGRNGKIYAIEFNDIEIIKKDTLKIICQYEKNEILIILVKNK